MATSTTSPRRRAAAKRPDPKPITAGRGDPAVTASRGEEVVSRILELVRNGNLHPGDRLPPERELIEIFSIGRPGLREALRSLSTLGVVEIRHGGGAFISDLNVQRLLAPLDLVLSLTPSILADSAECRRLIECEAVRKATLNATPADLLEFEEMMKAHAKVAGDLIGFRILDSRFHGKIYALANNAVLERMADSLYNLGLDVRRQVMGEPGQIEKSTGDHLQIFRAMQAGDPDAAAAAMAVHLQHIAETTEARLARTT